MPTGSIHTADAPTPGDFLSQAARIGNVVQVSGQGGATSVDGSVAHETVQLQTEQTLTNIDTVLRAGGLSFDDVVMFRVYLADRSAWTEMNASYEKAVRRRLSSDTMPARTTVIVGLPFENMHIEIDALAVVDDGA